MAWEVQVEFTRMLGVSSTYVGAMRRSLSDDKIMKVRRLFPDLNTDWLLYGQGDMLLESVVKAAADADELAAHGVRMVPLLPAAAYAGNIEAYSEGVVPEDCELIATQIRSAEMAVRVSGDSMEPKFHDGMVLFIRRINDRSFIPWGYPLVGGIASIPQSMTMRASRPAVSIRPIPPSASRPTLSSVSIGCWALSPYTVQSDSACLL